MNNQVSEQEQLATADTTLWTERYAQLQRLKENKDFQALILSGYLQQEAVRYTGLLATPYARQNNMRGTLVEELMAISCFEGFLATVEALGAPHEADENDEVTELE